MKRKVLVQFDPNAEYAKEIYNLAQQFHESMYRFDKTVSWEEYLTCVGVFVAECIVGPANLDDEQGMKVLREEAPASVANVALKLLQNMKVEK